MGRAAGMAGLIMLTASCQLVAGIEDTSLVKIDAGDGKEPSEHVVRGVAGGVREPVDLRLELAGGTEPLRITGDGPFAFDTRLAPGAAYNVVLVDEAPCVLDGAAGLIRDTDAELALACNGAATLSDLALSGPTAPDLRLSPGQLQYTVDVPMLQERVTITPVVESADATITIMGQPVASRASSEPLPLDLGDNAIEIMVAHPSGLQRTYRVTVRRAARIAQYVYGKASNTGAEDFFGYSVALSGDTLAVGAIAEDSAATGVGGTQNDDRAPDSGAVYVFRRNGSIWAQEAYIKASNTGTGDFFGWSVALSGDTLAVGAILEDSAATGVGGNQADNGAPDSGAVYVFRRNGSIWAQEAYIKASNTGAGHQFGTSVALASDTLAVGAPSEDSAATGVDGNQNDDLAIDSGAVYVFRRNGSTWAQEAYIKASNTGAGDQFGSSVALSGDTLAVGAILEDSAATGVGGNQLDNSARDSGAVYVFRRNGSAWAQEAYIKASNAGAGDQFGSSVALSGDTLAVGAPSEASATTGVGGNQLDNSARDSGAVYVFRRDGSTWAQEAYIKASNTDPGDSFGYHVALAGDTLAVGAPSEASAATGEGGNQADNSVSNSGAVYVFRRDGSAWTQEAYIKASNTSNGHFFGYGTALSSDTLAVGAWGEASAARGVGGNQADTSATQSGALYIFH